MLPCQSAPCPEGIGDPVGKIKYITPKKKKAITRHGRDPSAGLSKGTSEGSPVEVTPGLGIVSEVSLSFQVQPQPGQGQGQMPKESQLQFPGGGKHFNVDIKRCIRGT